MKLRMGYFADGPWAHRAFEKIIADDTLEIIFICVRYDNRDAKLVEYGEKYSIPVLWNVNINSDEFYCVLEEYKADLFVSMSFNQIFKERTINIPKMKTINCHAGKLPLYRGRNILNWALINDEKEFGITVHYVDSGIDTGDIILQKTYPISDEDTYATLLERAYRECAEVLYDAIKCIQAGNVNPIKQSDIDPVGMYCGMRQYGDEYISWNQSSREIFNFVRAISVPGPQATAEVRGEEIKINKVLMVPGAHVYKGIPGQIIGKTQRGFLVKTADSMVELTEYTCRLKLRVGDRIVQKQL